MSILGDITAKRLAARLPWWVNVYERSQGEPLEDRKWHATSESAERARFINAFSWNERPLYAIRIVPKETAA